MEDVIALFSNEAVLLHYPLKIQLIGERAIDTGGVCRDMLNEFWQTVYLQHFEGSNLLVPSVTANTDMGVMRALGRVLSHGYIFCGVLPTRIAYPTLHACFIGVSTCIYTSWVIYRLPYRFGTKCCENRLGRKRKHLFNWLANPINYHIESIWFKKGSKPTESATVADRSC